MTPWYLKPKQAICRSPSPNRQTHCNHSDLWGTTFWESGIRHKPNPNYHQKNGNARAATPAYKTTSFCAKRCRSGKWPQIATVKIIWTTEDAVAVTPVLLVSFWYPQASVLKRETARHRCWLHGVRKPIRASITDKIGIAAHLIALKMWSELHCLRDLSNLY